MEFKNRSHEEGFEVFFAERHVRWDLFVSCFSWMQYIPALVSIWRNRSFRSPIWLAAFAALYSAEKVIPTAMILFKKEAYIRHRTSISAVVRLLKMWTCDAFLSCWMDYSDKNSFREWTLLGTLFANNWISMMNWGLLHPTPDSCWLALHVGHLALLLWRQPSSLRQLEGGLHHLAPLTGVVNAMGAKLGMGPFSGRDVLFWVWLLLEVIGGFVLPLWLTYRMQLSSRRQWRRGFLKRHAESPRGGSSSSGGPSTPDRDPGLDIWPTWTLFLPQSAALLVLSFVAGHDFKLLQYVV
ncbi:g9988 [Coccomyxa elongata]